MERKDIFLFVAFTFAIGMGVGFYLARVFL